MKKLFALLVVAGMVFVSCGNTQKEEPAVEAEGAEMIDETATEQEDAVQMDAEEAPAEDVVAE